jgi:[ribosomal protein S5]-alanine N-acetyltransferase
LILPKSLETARLRLRSLSATDCNERYLAWMNDPEVQRFLEARTGEHSLGSLRDYVAAANAAPGMLLLGIIDRADEAHVGNIKLGPIERTHHRASIGLLLGDRERWRRGYATEAIAALAQYAVGTLGIEKLTAGIYDGNVASLRAFERAGFVREARLARHARLDGHRIDVLLLALHS